MQNKQNMDKAERNAASTRFKDLNPGENIKHGSHDASQSSSLNPPTSSKFQNSRINQNFKIVTTVSSLSKNVLSEHENMSKISRSVSLNDSLNDISRTTNGPLMKWSYLNGSSLSLPSSNIQPVSASETLFDHIDEENSQLREPVSPSTAKVKVLPLGIPKKSGVHLIQNTSEVPSKKLPKISIDGDKKCQIFSGEEKTENCQAISKPNQQNTDEFNRKPKRSYSELITRTKIINEFEARQTVKEIRVSLFEDQEKRNSDQSLNCFEEKKTNSDTEESKDANFESNEDFQTTNFDDDMRMNYVERPLLPLKPLQQQRSLSCTNLVQAIKGLSKRKASLSNKKLSPENTLAQTKEMSTSDANISNVCRRKLSEESAEQKFRNVNVDIQESLKTQNVRQSLQCYAWYHLVDAKEARRRLLNMNQNGAFLIRPASNPTREHFHTLCVLYYGEVYNFHIKNTKNGYITLRKDITFTSILNLIKHYQNAPVPITIGSRKGQVYLRITPPK